MSNLCHAICLINFVYFKNYYDSPLILSASLVSGSDSPESHKLNVDLVWIGVHKSGEKNWVATWLRSSESD